MMRIYPCNRCNVPVPEGEHCGTTDYLCPDCYGAEAQWIDTMHAVVNDAYSQFDEGEITQEKAAAIIREAIALDPTNKG